MDDKVSMGHAKCIGETPKALLVRIEDDDKDLWVPKSVVHDDSEVWSINQTGELIVAEWWGLENSR